MSEWSLLPGDTIVRKELHDRYGGRRFGGIGDSAKTPNIFCFTDPATGRQHGYNDGWVRPGELFLYTGEGQVGDQQFTAGNAAIATHAQTGRAIRLFRGTGGLVTYLGEFALDPSQPYFFDDAPETADGPLRQVIVFRLIPAGPTVFAPEENADAPPPGVSAVPVEQQHTESFWAAPGAQPLLVERREQQLVRNYQRFLEAQGSTVVRHRYVPTSGAKPLYSDLFDETRGLLVEAKGSVTRGSIRMAIGQLADYSRFEPAPHGKAVLLPGRPRDDLVDLLAGLQIGLVYPLANGFREQLAA